MPLPDGATMVTFQDITDSVNVERALRERNEALEDADQIKVDFVHHVSYELRSPLTNIIGFVHLLGDPATGPLVPKQREYLDYITVSTEYAARDHQQHSRSCDHRRRPHAAQSRPDRYPQDHGGGGRGHPGPAGERRADPRHSMSMPTSATSSPTSAAWCRCCTICWPMPSAFRRRRDRRPGGRAPRAERSVIFSVTDSGPGIPPDVKEKVFNWFESHSNGSRHRGAGPRPVAGALLRRTAWRQGAASIRSSARARPSPATFRPERPPRGRRRSPRILIIH